MCISLITFNINFKNSLLHNVNTVITGMSCIRKFGNIIRGDAVCSQEYSSSVEA